MSRIDGSYLLGNRGFVALLLAQLFGFLNDNIFKMMVSLLAVGMAGSGQEGGTLSLASIVFLVPYLLFSGYAGYAADAFGNRPVLIAGKLAELVIIALAVGALWLGNIGLLLGILFLLATQATFFSPAKYSLVRDVAPAAALQRANGLLEISRFGAIIVGTALGGWLLELHAAWPGLAGVVLLAISAAGLAATFLIPRCLPQGAAPAAPRPLRLNPWAEIAGGLRWIARDPRLRSAVAGLCFFEAVGALLLLDIILIGHDALRLGSTATGLLGAFVGIGLAIGSLVAGQCARRSVEIGMVPFGVAGVGLLLIATALWGRSHAATVGALLAIGLCGALCLVPLTASLQRHARAGQRGGIIATSNFLSMASVLAASVGLWLLRDIARMDPWAILLLAGIAALGWTCLTLLAFPGYAAAARAWGGGLLRRAGRGGTVARAAALVIALSLVPAPPQRAEAATLSDATTHRYRVVHSVFGEIGRFQQTIRLEGDLVLVDSRLEVVVRVLFSTILLHDVDSSSHEVWRDGELLAYHGIIREDGAVSEVRGAATQGAFAVSGPDGHYVLPATVYPMSPWSIALSRATLLLSPETGMLRQVTIVKAPPQLLALNGRSILCRRFVARGDESFELWYDENGAPVKFTVDAAAGTVSFLRQ